MKSTVRASLAGLALLGVASPGGGRAVAAPPTTAPPATALSGPASPPPTAAPGKDPLLEFVPKEHVPADSAVSFPVDI